METGDWSISCHALLVARVPPAGRTLPLNTTAPAPAAVHSLYVGRVDVFFYSLCCHTDLATTLMTVQRLKATLTQRTERRDHDCNICVDVYRSSHGAEFIPRAKARAPPFEIVFVRTYMGISEWQE